MKSRSSLKVMFKLVGLIKPLIFIMAIAIITGVLGFLAAILIPILGGYAILNVLGVSSSILGIGTMSFTTIFIIVICLAIIRGFLRYIEQTCNHYIAFKLLALIRSKVFSSLRQLAPAKLEVKEKGDLIALVTSDIELLEVFYAHTISPVFIAFIVSVIMSVFIFLFNVYLGIIAVLGYFIIGVIMPIITSKMSKKKGEDYRKQFASMNSFIYDSMRGMEEIVQYDKGQERMDSIKKQTFNLQKKSKSLLNISSVTGSLMGVVMSVIAVVMMIVGTILYQNTCLGIDGIIIPTITIFSSFGPVIAVSNLGTGLTQTIASGNRVLDLIEEVPMVSEKKDGVNIDFEGVTYNNVSFSYDELEIIKNFSLKIDKNNIIGITGKSGSGKSTLLKLLMRFWDVDNGSIDISKIDIKNINTKSLRENQSFVTQETVLFKDTIENNIKIASLKASSEDIIDACKKASIHDFIISLPKGYQTNVSELGSSLSGGQRQRIGLARAFLHNAPLLLLDEPTSNIDSLNEAIILNAIRNDKNRTIVLVSHRQSTSAIANKEISLDSDRES